MDRSIVFARWRQVEPIARVRVLIAVIKILLGFHVGFMTLHYDTTPRVAPLLVRPARTGVDLCLVFSVRDRISHWSMRLGLDVIINNKIKILDCQTRVSS